MATNWAAIKEVLGDGPLRWAAIKEVLGDGPLRRGRFKDSLIASMNRRKTVCIRDIVEEIRKALGEEYAIWAEEILIAAANESWITVECPEDAESDED